MTKSMFRVLGVVASLVVGGAADAAVEWKVSDGGNGHFYGYGRVQISDATFLQVRDAAVLKGGHLPTVTSEAENTFVFQNIGGGLGLFRQPGGAWQNVTGEPAFYQNWAPGDPNGSTTNLVFAAYCCHPSSTWADYSDADLGNPAEPYTEFRIEWEADCNGDGVVDYGQIQSGELADTNHNNIPDVCELVITSVQPISGASIGGTAVKINGNNFPISPIVTFGGVSATDIVRVTPSLITAVTPAGTPGMTLVAVNGASSESFYYRPNCGSDLDNNGVVDSADVGIVLLDIGNCSESLTTPQEQEPMIFQITEPPTPVPNKK